MSSRLPVAVRGDGRPLLCVHGSATDRGAWTIQLASMADRFRVIAPDRRGAPSTPLAPDERPTTADHAADLVAVLDAHAAGPALVIGSSFGGVVALELARRAPARVAGLVLCEPPLPPWPDAPRAPIGFGCALARLAATGGGERAAELFLRAVLGDASFDRMAPPVRARALATWPQIQADARALGAYRYDLDALRRVTTPTLLLGGDRSPPRFADGLDALELALPRVRRATIAGAGHAMQIDQPRTFERLVRGFADEAFG